MIRSSSRARRDRHERRAAELRRRRAARPCGPPSSRAALNTSASAPREVVSPASSVMPAADTNAVSKRSPRRNSTRPAARDGARVLIELARADDHVELLGADLGGDDRRVGDERQLVRRVLRQAPRERERARGRVEEDRRPAARSSSPPPRRSRSSPPRAWPSAVVPRRGVRVRPALVRERARTPAHALDQPLARQLLEVAMGRHRRHGVVARELGDGGAAARAGSARGSVRGAAMPEAARMVMRRADAARPTGARGAS